MQEQLWWIHFYTNLLWKIIFAESPYRIYIRPFRSFIDLNWKCYLFLKNMTECWYFSKSLCIPQMYHKNMEKFGIIFLQWNLEGQSLLWDIDECYRFHYSDVIMAAMASQITSLAIVYLTVYLGTDQRKHQSSMSLAFVWGIHEWEVNCLHKWPVTQKLYPFDDVIMSMCELTYIWTLPKYMPVLHSLWIVHIFITLHIWVTILLVSINLFIRSW